MKDNRFINSLKYLLHNSKVLSCLLLAWMITNGWAYVAWGISTVFKIGWLFTISSSYLALLWLPATPEKIITVFIAYHLVKTLYPQEANRFVAVTGFSGLNRQ